MAELFDTDPERLANGVRVRRDGKGDTWSNEHREELGNTFFLSDIDAVIGHLAFAKTGDAEFFAEYVPDSFANHGKVIRKFATVAFFDRKKSGASVYPKLNSVALAFYLSLCRVIANSQPVPPKFFFIIGQESPWQMVEVDINTGEKGKSFNLEKGKWPQVWEASGLTDMRNVLRRWVEKT